MATIFCFTYPHCLNEDCEKHPSKEVDCPDMDCFSDKLMHSFCRLYTTDKTVYESDEYQALKAQIEAGDVEQFVTNAEEAG